MSQSTMSLSCRRHVSLVEPVLSRRQSVLLKDAASTVSPVRPEPANPRCHVEYPTTESYQVHWHIFVRFFFVYTNPSNEFFRLHEQNTYRLDAELFACWTFCLLLLLLLLFLSVINSFKTRIFHEYHQSVKQFGSRSGPTVSSSRSGSKLFPKVVSRRH